MERAYEHREEKQLKFSINLGSTPSDSRGYDTYYHGTGIIVKITDLSKQSGRIYLRGNASYVSYSYYKPHDCLPENYKDEIKRRKRISNQTIDEFIAILADLTDRSPKTIKKLLRESLR